MRYKYPKPSFFVAGEVELKMIGWFFFLFGGIILKKIMFESSSIGLLVYIPEVLSDKFALVLENKI